MATRTFKSILLDPYFKIPNFKSPLSNLHFQIHIFRSPLSDTYFQISTFRYIFSEYTLEYALNCIEYSIKKHLTSIDHVSNFLIILNEIDLIFFITPC
jgi:hypothetical protein